MYDEIPDDDEYLMVGGDFIIGNGGGSSSSSSSGPQSIEDITSPPTPWDGGVPRTTTNNELTDRQEIAMSVLFVLSGVLSIMGSLTIIYKVLFKKSLLLQQGPPPQLQLQQQQPVSAVNSDRNPNINAAAKGGRRSSPTSQGSMSSSNKSNNTPLPKRRRTSFSSVMTSPLMATKLSTPSTPYDRIMLGLSVFDVIASLTFALTPFMAPEYHNNNDVGQQLNSSSSSGGGYKALSSRVWSVGNDSTCTILGFLQQLSFAAVWYNCMLSYYYLATIRFGMKRHTFAQRYEKWIHVATALFFLSTATVGAAMGFYSEVDTGMGCWVNDYPKNCEITRDCISPQIGWVYAGGPVLFTLLSLIINNLIIYIYVRRTFRGTDQQNGTTTTAAADSSQAMGTSLASRVEQRRKIRYEAHIRQVATQGLLYVVTFILAYTPAIIIRVIETYSDVPPEEPPLYPLLLVNSLLLPLQGFFNMFVYNRPTYLKFRHVYPEKSYLWSIRMACFHDQSQLPNVSRQYVSSATNKLNSPLGGGTHGRYVVAGGNGSSSSIRSQQRKASYQYYSYSSSGKNFSSTLDAVLEVEEEKEEDDHCSGIICGSAQLDDGESDYESTNNNNEESVVLDVTNDVGEVAAVENNPESINENGQ